MEKPTSHYTKPDMNETNLIEYWKKCRDTIEHFDRLILKYNTQSMTILSAILTASGFMYFEGLQLIAIILSVLVIICSISLMFQSRLYQKLLIKSIETTIHIENLLFNNSPKQIKLTHNLDIGVPAKQQTKIYILSYLIIIILGLTVIIISFIDLT